jgi:hypothetical protein
VSEWYSRVVKRCVLGIPQVLIRVGYCKGERELDLVYAESPTAWGSLSLPARE